MAERTSCRTPIAIILAIAVMTVIGVVIERHFDLQEVRRFSSPDGRHALIVYRRPPVFSAPGQGSDAAGIVVLETRAGVQLRQMPVEMVQLVEDPEWTTDRVRLKLLLDWPLPE